MACNCENSLQNCNCSEPIELISRGPRGLTGTGVAGADGADGVALLLNDTTAVNSTIATTLKTYSLLADELDDNGDALEITIIGKVGATGGSLSYGGIQIRLDSQAIALVKTIDQTNYFNLKCILTKVSDTSSYYTFESKKHINGSYDLTTEGYFNNSIIVVDFTSTQSITINSLVGIAGTSSFTISQFMIKKFKI